MKLRHIVLGTAVAAFEGVSFTLSAQNNVIDEVVWVVGDEAIYKSEVEDARQEASMNGVHWDGDPYCIIPEQLAVNKLFLNQAELDSITVSPDDVNDQVEYRYNFYESRMGSREKLEEYWKMSAELFRLKLYETCETEMIVSKVRDKIMERVKVTPGDVRRYMKDISPDEIPYVPNQVEVQIITMDPVIPQEEIDAVKSDLRQYTERITSGEVPFSTLAILYSEDPESAKNGGDCGFVGRGEIVPEFAAVAFNLTDPEKVSKIVETEYGFHIIQLIERLGDRVRVRHILRKPRIPMSSIDECLSRLDTVAQNIRSGKYTFESAVTSFSSDKDTRNNNGLMANQPEPGMPKTSKYEMQQLPPDVAKVIDRMHVGEVSDPFTMQLRNGKVVCAIVKLKNKITGHKATMADDYEELHRIVSEIRREEAIEKWIREKQRTTYVKISEGWNDCEFMYPGWGKQ
ncbi:MAG: peptidylprolyl isomerase [Bacteroidaceae bacterium]|nr:peptidylprolyl isomerase [Bacteroidaceae bacterium]MBP5647410.1 peptidylprolyl isomerase [Bacteroidaceae bacterium]